MVKVAKAGMKVEKELLAIEKQFASIWRETGKHQPKATEAAGTVKTANDGILHSISKDIESFDNSWYNEIEISASEQARVQSEALTWNANKRNQLISQTLSNGIKYRYVIDDDGIVHIYGKEQSENIHDWKEDYGNTNTTRPDSIAEELWAGYGNDSIDSSFSQDGRNPKKDDTNGDYFVLGEGRSNRTGYSKDRANAYGKPKKRGWHFKEDGSVEATYGDGTKETENTAPIKETSSDDGVFFDGTERNFSLSGEQQSDIAPMRRDVVYSLDKYTKKQYNDFGWARDAEAITKNELDDLYSKIQEKRSLKKFRQSTNGEAVVEVNDDPHANLGVDNVFAFVTGTKNNPQITRVVRVNAFDEESLDIIRKDIYESTSNRALETYARRIGEEFLQYYDRNNHADYRAYTDKSRTQRSGSQSERDSAVNRNGHQRRITFEETELNEIAPVKEASSDDGVFFDDQKVDSSLSNKGEQYAPYGDFAVYGKDISEFADS